MSSLSYKQGESRSNKLNDKVIDDVEKQRFLVHQDIYTDSEIFDLEILKFFEGNWIYLAHESQLKKPNDYLTLYMGRQPVILARNESGELKCFLNRCRHRGAQVCRDEKGSSSRFRCFYHGWTYSNDGKLVGVTDPKGYSPNFNYGELGLKEIPCLEVYKGFIFGSLEENVPTLKEHLGKALPYFDLMVDKYSEKIEVAKGVMKYAFEGNWKLQCENALDFYHLPFVHKSFLDAKRARGLKAKNFNDMKSDRSVYFGNGHGSTIARVYEDGQSPSEIKKTNSSKEKWMMDIHQHLFIFPNLVILENPAPQIRIINPISVKKTQITAYAYFPKDVESYTRTRLLRSNEIFFGPAGMGTPDDMEAFHSSMKGYQAHLAPWNDLSRGMHREVTELDLSEIGPFELAGNITDDTIYRGLYRFWYKQMSESTEKR